MVLAGVQHITIAPSLLKELSITPAASLSTLSLFDGESSKLNPDSRAFVNDAAGYRLAFTRSENGEAERKLTQVSQITAWGGVC
jgi:transaldolase